MAISRGYYTNSISGLQEVTIRHGYAGATGSTHFQISDVRSNLQQERYALEFGISRQDDIVHNLANMKEFDYAMRRIKFGGLASNGDKTLPFLGYGIEPEPEAKLRDGLVALKKQSKNLQLGDEIRRLTDHKQGVLLGKNLAEALGLKVGDPFMLLATTVSGAVNAIDVEFAGIRITGAEEVDNYALLTKLGTAQRLINTDRVSEIAVMFTNRQNLNEKKHQLEEVFTHFPDQKFSIRNWEELGHYYRSVRDLLQIIFLFLGTIIIVIVMMSCWNIVNLTTMERIREIGTLRAIGLSIYHITSIFLLEGFLIGIASVGVGLGLQLVAVYAINAAQIPMPPIPGTYESYLLIVDFLTSYHLTIALFIIGTLTFSAVSSFFVIKRLSIVEALDHA